jgi:hypothetical protein
MFSLKTKVEMTNLGYFNFYLGVEFLSVNKGIFMRQKDNMQRILEQLSMRDYNLPKRHYQMASNLRKKKHQIQ